MPIVYHQIAVILSAFCSAKKIRKSNYWADNVIPPPAKRVQKYILRTCKNKPSIFYDILHEGSHPTSALLQTNKIK